MTDFLERQRENKKRTKPAINQAVFEQGKLPPQAIDLEEAVLGALMLEKDALTNVMEILHPQLFYKEAHERIF